jgi:pyruvate dehydrogenase (quinone)/pyruvate oxidase
MDRGAGLSAMQITEPAACGQQLDSAVANNGPVLIEAVVDPFTPPMPAKVKAGQAIKFAESLLRGEPNRAKIALTQLHDRVRELV